MSFDYHAYVKKFPQHHFEEWTPEEVASLSEECDRLANENSNLLRNYGEMLNSMNVALSWIDAGMINYAKERLAKAIDKAEGRE